MPDKTTRQAFINAARELIDEHGESGARVEDIVEKSGHAVSSLYHYFGSIRGLIEATQLERLREVPKDAMAYFRNGMQAVNTPQELRKYVEDTFRQFLATELAVSRVRRLQAVGNSYLNEEFTSAVSETFENSVQETLSVMNMARDKGLVSPEIDLEAYAVWTCSTQMGRTVLDLYGDPIAIEKWMNFTISSALQWLRISDV